MSLSCDLGDFLDDLNDPNLGDSTGLCLVLDFSDENFPRLAFIWNLCLSQIQVVLMPNS
jgi:hypothetical protein